MKKIVLTLILIIFAVSIYAASFTVFGKVYNEDGSKGTSLTANSYCGLKVYRKSIPGEIGVQNIGPDENCIQKIFPAYFGGQDTAAYFNSDVGSNNWVTVTGVGQSVIAVVEVYNGQFPLCPWNGASYTGARIMVLLQQNIDNGGVDMPDIRLNAIPAPQPQTISSDSITLTWRGLSYDPDNLIKGYTVYRSTEPGGVGGYTQLTVTANQVKGGTVYFTDTCLNQNYTYYYKIAVNFEWGGGNGTPDYFISNAMSDASIGIYLGPTPTITQTETNTPVCTPTYTFTETYTCTFTYSPTDTITATDTITITVTPTFTDTQTLTHTLTFTPTISFTMTVTFSNTYTQTFTATITNTLTLTPTITPTMIITPQPQIAELLKNKLLREKIVILNNPVRDGMLKIALYNANNAIVYFSLYNISGELVMQFNKNINGGFAMVQEKISKAPGIYILRTVVKTDTETINLPLKKVGVIKN